ncbi:hypothetical protein ACJJTC_004559 [Scirpophaga incertulas]
MGCFFSRGVIDHEVIYDMTPIKHLPVIFVSGVPGAGNHTVAQTISSITGYEVVRPGELVAAEAMKDTPRGRLIANRLQARDDLPEQLTVDLIKEAMLMKQDAIGFILVGFPTSPRMSNMFQRQVKWPEKIVALEVDNEVAATRLQTKLSELGRPESEVNAARQIVRDAAHKVKSVHKRFGGHVVRVDSNGNPTALATALKNILSDTLEMSQKRRLEANKELPTAPSASGATVPTSDSEINDATPLKPDSLTSPSNTQTVLISEPALSTDDQ